MSLGLALREQYFEVESVKDLEAILPDIVLQSLNYCGELSQPFTPSVVLLTKDKVTVHFLVDFEHMMTYFDVLKTNKTIDCAAAHLRGYMSTPHSIDTTSLAHEICEQIQKSVNLQNGKWW